MKPSIRSAVRTVSLIATMAQALDDFFWRWIERRGRMTPEDRARWLHSWCSRALPRLGIEFNQVGHPPQRGLIVANHLSYLDVLLFSAAAPCIFVSKSEVGKWPLIGTLLRCSGTILINRTRPADVLCAGKQITQALREGIPVVLFPEGTSTDGSFVSRFHPALFEPAIQCGAEITSARVDYVVDGGNAAEDVCYWGDMTLVPHLLRLLSKLKIRGQIQFLLRARRFDSRKEAANATWMEVASMKSGVRSAKQDCALQDVTAA
jgi:1-acyl-sn-glycerol-3-phosphate acyltransferase